MSTPPRNRNDFPLEITWNILVNLGIKCNINKISQNAGIRYFSSPFDNIDTVDGLVSAARLMASGFEGHMNDVTQWKIRNVRSKDKIIAKSLTHQDVPDIQYPHFYAGWSKGQMTQEEVKQWVENEETNILKIWPYLAENFIRRQKRLVSLLKSRNSLLFLRIDTLTNGGRNMKHNQNEDLRQFMALMKKAYPSTTLGLLYFYYNSGKFQRSLEPDDSIHPVLIPEGTEEDLEKFVLEKISLLKILPREKMEPFDFKD